VSLPEHALPDHNSTEKISLRKEISPGKKNGKKGGLSKFLRKGKLSSERRLLDSSTHMEREVRGNN